MKHRVALIGMLAAVAPLAGCHPWQALHDVGGSCHDVKPYQKAQSVSTLQIPSGLDTPDTTNALHIPKLNEPVPPPRTKKDPCLDAAPPFAIPKPVTPQA
jgi:uncharacterized lipoprotein